ncbi:MAG: hypothetical protein ACJ786_27615 [Catenulispora sp.]
MPDDLVTAAVFGDHTQATAARLLLEASGVPAFLADENVAGGIFTLGTAVGGIRLQVPKSRLEESLRLLDERMPTDGGATDWSDVDVGRPEDDEPSGEEPVGTTPAALGATTPAADAGPEEDLTQRERRADGLLRAWVFGLIFFPLMLLVFLRLVQVWTSDERLGPGYRRKAQLAGALLVLTCVVPVAVCCALPR